MLRKGTPDVLCHNQPMNIARTLALGWVLLSLLATALWLQAGWRAQQARFATDSSISHRLLSQKIVQHEAVLTVLGSLPSPPPLPALLSSLHTAMPQLQAVARWQDSQWQGYPRAPTAPRAYRWQTLPDREGRYWLLSPAGWAMLIDSQQLLAAGEWPPNVGRITLTLPDGAHILLQRPGTGTLARFHLDKRLPGQAQAFAFHSEGSLGSTQLPWAGWLASCLALATLLAVAGSRWQARHVARQHAEQQRLAAISRLSTLGEMAASMAHELNQPLTAILANLRAAGRLLDDDEERDNVRRAIQSSAEQAKRAGDIIARLRSLVSPQSRPAPTRLDLPAMLASLQRLHAPVLAAQGLRLQLDCPPVDIPLCADAVAVEQILHNLVQNAAEALAGRQGGEIRIRVRHEAGLCQLSVADNGPGLSAERLAQPGLPFRSSKAGGLGLGLSLCDSLATGMGGQLSAANLPGGGACLTLTLPCPEPYHV